jgi:hypothetical protein
MEPMYLPLNVVITTIQLLYFVGMIAFITVLYGAVLKQEKRMKRYSTYNLRQSFRQAIKVWESSSSRRSSMKSARKRKKKPSLSQGGAATDVAMKGLKYAGAWFITWVWWYAIVFIEIRKDAPPAPAWLYIIHSFFSPLQGLFNFLVYHKKRPNQRLPTFCRCICGKSERKDITVTTVVSRTGGSTSVSRKTDGEITDTNATNPPSTINDISLDERYDTNDVKDVADGFDAEDEEEEIIFDDGGDDNHPPANNSLLFGYGSSGDVDELVSEIMFDGGDSDSDDHPPAKNSLLFGCDDVDVDYPLPGSASSGVGVDLVGPSDSISNDDVNDTSFRITATTTDGPTEALVPQTETPVVETELPDTDSPVAVDVNVSAEAHTEASVVHVQTKARVSLADSSATATVPQNDNPVDQHHAD